MSDEAHKEDCEDMGKLPEIILDIEASVIQTPPVVVLPGETAKINGGGGLAIQGNADTGGGDFTGRDTTRNDLRYNSVGSQQLFISPDNAALWQASMQLLKDMNDVAVRLDNIPNRMEALEKFLHTPSVVVPAISVPVTAAINVPLQSWLLIILIFLILLAGGIWISSMIAKLL